ncbi:MAG: hypothetical protein RI560_07815, partial [Natronomonas sp.]|nr:hypothetical protein [Natronomonas sp.]
DDHRHLRRRGEAVIRAERAGDPEARADVEERRCRRTQCLELANGDYEQLDVFKSPTFDKDLALGVVDVHTTEVETVEEIKENIVKGFEIVPPEQLTVSPDCGVKLLPRGVAYQKMENMVTAAREVEAELDAGEITVGYAGE